MSNPHLGSCLCGEVRFRIDGGFERFYLCHCEHCRKDSGSAHAANLFSSSARLEWISGQERVSTFNLPGTRHAKSFCSTCGSALPFVTGKMVVVPAGCLDTDLAMAPDAHLFGASRAGWDQGLEGLPTFDGYPS